MTVVAPKCGSETRTCHVLLLLCLALIPVVSLSGCLNLVQTGSIDTSSPPIPSTQLTPTTIVDEVTVLVQVRVNEERAKISLPALKWDPFLEDLAAEHSENMARLNNFSHDRLGWRNVNYEQKPGTVRAENLALTPVRRFRPGPLLSAAEIADWTIEGWLDSPSHRETMLDHRLALTGIAVVRTDDYFWITQDFEGPLD